MTTVHIHIERLVLDGWTGTARDAALVQEAVSAELDRAFAVPGADANLMSQTVPRSSGGTVTANQAPSAMGAAIGQATLRGISS